MDATGWFAVFVLPMFFAGYLGGRFIVARELHFPFPVAAVGNVVLAILTTFIVLRTVQHIIAEQHIGVAEVLNFIGAYADVTVITAGVMVGYQVAPRRKAKSIKSGITVSEDGGLQLVDPFTDQAEVSLGETNH
jgi:hypothetical protein